MIKMSRPATVWINGSTVPEADATVSVFDRSFLYGDGLFETIRVYRGSPFRWTQHLERLQAGADALGIRLPFTVSELTEAAGHLIQENSATEAVLRLTLSRGVGPRGYSPRGADRPLLIMTLHPAPTTNPASSAGWTLITSRFRLPAGDSLATFKTANKLIQVLARAEAEERGADEALLLNTDGNIAEAAASNLFWIEGDEVCTPPLVAGALAGVTRAFVLELCRDLGLETRERTGPGEHLLAADGVFLTLSSLGIVPATHLDGTQLAASPITKRLQDAYHQAVHSIPTS